MLESQVLFIGRVAFLWTLVTVAGAAYVDAQDTTGDSLATVGGVVGFVLWGVWTFGVLNVEVVDGGSTTVFTHPELAILGVAMALVPGYVALTGPIELIKRARDPEMTDL